MYADFAFDVPAQAQIIQDAQQQGELIRADCTFFNSRIVQEWGKQWVSINDGEMVLYGPHCDLVVLRKLEYRDTISKIGLPEKLEIFNFGSKKVPLAALFFGSELVYWSPGFDLMSHLSNQTDNGNQLTLSDRSLKMLKIWFITPEFRDSDMVLLG